MRARAGRRPPLVVHRASRCAASSLRTEDTAMKSRIKLFAPLAPLALLCLLAVGCQTTARDTRPLNSEDVDTSVTLPRTFENVWYRSDTQPENHIPYAAEGTLLVTGDVVTFTGTGASLSIATRDIRDVLWRTLNGDLQNEWAIIYYREGGTEKIVGFTPGDRYRFHTSSKELYSAIVMAFRGQSRR
jgi:hypothetical protein